MYFGLLDTIAVFLENMLKIVCCAIAVGVLTYLTLAMKPPQYLAHATVPLRHADITLLTSPAVLLVVAEDTDSQGRHNSKLHHTLAEITSGLTVSLVGNNYRISVTSSSPQESKAILTAILDELRKATRLRGAELERLQNRIERKQQTIRIARRFIALIGSAGGTTLVDPTSNDALAKIEKLASDSAADIANLRILMDPYNPRRFAEKPSSDPDPIFISKREPTLYGMTIGACIMVLVAFAREWWQRTASDRARAVAYLKRHR